MSDFETPTTPPTGAPDQTPDDLPEPQDWPKPVGITSVVLGGLNLTCSGLGATWMILVPLLFLEPMKQRFSDGLPPMLESVSIPLLGSIAFGMIAEVLLIVAGATLLMRRAIARPLHLAYAVVGLISFAISTYIGVQYQAEMTEWIKQNPDTVFAQQQAAGGMIGQILGWTWGILMGFAWPAFCAVWFGVIKKAADITQGRRETI